MRQKFNSLIVITILGSLASWQFSFVALASAAPSHNLQQSGSLQSEAFLEPSSNLLGEFYRPNEDMMASLKKIVTPQQVSQAVSQHREIGRPELESYSISRVDGFALVGGIDLDDQAQAQEVIMNLFNHEAMREHFLLDDFLESHSVGFSEGLAMLVDSFHQPAHVGSWVRLKELLEYSSETLDESSELEVGFAESSQQIKVWLNKFLKQPTQSYEYSYSKDYINQKCVIALSADHAWVVCYEMNL